MLLNEREGGKRHTERKTHTQINSMDGKGSSEVDGIQVKVRELVIGGLCYKEKIQYWAI